MNYIDKSDEINHRIHKEYIKVRKMKMKIKQEKMMEDEENQKNKRMEYREKIIEEMNKKSPLKINRNKIDARAIMQGYIEYDPISKLMRDLAKIPSYQAV